MKNYTFSGDLHIFARIRWNTEVESFLTETVFVKAG